MASDLTQYSRDVDHFFSSLSKEAFEEVPCLLCKTPTESVLLFHKGTQEIRRCLCGLVWNAHQAKEDALVSFYQESSALKRWSEIKETPGEIRRQEQKFLATVKYLARFYVRSVLDVGCGNGLFLSLLNAALPEARLTGSDLSPDAGTACGKRGVRWKSWDLKQALVNNPETYDAITLWGVLEHVKDPVSVLRAASARLNPNGFLVVCVPNVQSLVVTHLWEKCFTFCPQHLWHFDHSSLTSALSQAGFESVQWRTVEPERVPTLKVMAGLDPYLPSPEWSYAVAKNVLLDEDILKQGLGYKIVLIAQASQCKPDAA